MAAVSKEEGPHSSQQANTLSPGEQLKSSTEHLIDQLSRTPGLLRLPAFRERKSTLSTLA